MIHVVWQVVSVGGVFCVLTRKGPVTRKLLPRQFSQCLISMLSGRLAWRHLKVRQYQDPGLDSAHRNRRVSVQPPNSDILFQWIQVLGTQRTKRDGGVVREEHQPSALFTRDTSECQQQIFWNSEGKHFSLQNNGSYWIWSHPKRVTHSGKREFLSQRKERKKKIRKKNYKSIRKKISNFTPISMVRIK